MADPAVPTDPQKLPQAPKPLAAPKPVGQVFQQQRERAIQGANQGAQQGQDALKRRLTAMGQLNSGVGIQAQQEQQANSAQQMQDATAGIDAAESQQAASSEQAQKQMDYQNRVLELDEKVKMGQMSLAQAEAARDAITTEFNKAVTAREQGFGVDLAPLLDQEFMARSYESQQAWDRAKALRSRAAGNAARPEQDLSALYRRMAQYG